MNYHHTQRGTFILASVGLVLALLVALSVTIGGVQPVVIGVAALMVLVLLQFSSLTVEVVDGGVSLRFGPGIIRKRIPLAEIRNARPVTNPWLAGWGIRWIPGQYWLWNVSGLKAVELEFRDGGRFRIGTDEPEALAAAILGARGAGHRPEPGRPS